jgi:GntR family transcriptional regulator
MTHRWEEVADEIRHRVAQGQHGQAGDIGTEQVLGEEFGVSRITIRRALTQLRDEGLLVAGRGKGWRVAGVASGEPIGWFRITSASADGEAADLDTQILSFEMASTPATLGALPGPGLRLRKLVSAGGTPFDLSEITIAAPYAEAITQRELTTSPPARLLSTKGCPVGRTDQFVTASTATLDDEPLRIEPGEPILVVERTVFTVDDEPVLRTIHRHPGSRTRIELSFPTTDQTDTPTVRVLHDR